MGNKFKKYKKNVTKCPPPLRLCREFVSCRLKRNSFVCPIVAPRCPIVAPRCPIVAPRCPIVAPRCFHQFSFAPVSDIENLIFNHILLEWNTPPVKITEQQMYVEVVDDVRQKQVIKNINKNMKTSLKLSVKRFSEPLASVEAF